MQPQRYPIVESQVGLIDTLLTEDALFGLPEDIISDRGPQFISKF